MEFQCLEIVLGFLEGPNGKESACNTGVPRLDPWVRKIPWTREWQATPGSVLENFMDWGIWQATVHGVTRSQTWLSTWNTYTHRNCLRFVVFCYLLLLYLVQNTRKTQPTGWLYSFSRSISTSLKAHHPHCPDVQVCNLHSGQKVCWDCAHARLCGGAQKLWWGRARAKQIWSETVSKISLMENLQTNLFLCF